MSCPIGTACHARPDCQDTACPGHPGQRVARIGHRYHGPEPLPPITWRHYLKDLARAMLLVIAVMFAGAFLVSIL